MKKILLACNLGMSTSLLVERMKTYANKQGIECQIEAMAVSAAQKVVGEWDVCLIGPQVRYTFASMKKASSTPVVVIDTRAYGLMDGEAVMKAAMEAMN